MNENKAIVIDVKGMTCEGCVNAVTRIVKRADPQAEVNVDLASGRVDAKSAVAAETLAKAIKAGGYEATAR